MLPLTLEDLDAATDRARARLAKNPELVAAMETLGRERALIYKTLVLTGLRKGELASITVGQVVLDAALPYLVLERGRRKEPRRIDATPSGRSCRRSSRMACREGCRFAGSRRERSCGSV